MNDGDFVGSLRTQRKRRLAACLATTLGLASSSVLATVFVSNCNDAGPGSLRNAIGGAPSGETVDASGLEGVCSKITLTTGAIFVDKNGLTVKGPGRDELAVTAKNNNHQYKDRIFTHFGTGLLYLKDITLSKGYVSDVPLQGGCIYSKGSVTLANTSVTGCQVRGTEPGDFAFGGGIFAKGSLVMKQSSLTFNVANGKARGNGGGAYSNGFRAYYSNVLANAATNEAAADGNFGGIESVGKGDVYLFNSTIGLNQAAGTVAGLGVSGSEKVTIVNSTISSNSAINGRVGGALVAATKSIEISNSTIAANTAHFYGGYPVGLTVLGDGSAATFVMHSSIIANNSYGTPPATESDLASTVVITGSNNLVQISTASMPGDTIVGKCAFLGPLQDNGGLTLTQAPQGHSPAIDKGNNTFGASFDQRGKQSVNDDANYPRVLSAPGVAPRADIGAYEVNGADEIYDSDFDSC